MRAAALSSEEGTSTTVVPQDALRRMLECADQDTHWSWHCDGAERGGDGAGGDLRRRDRTGAKLEGGHRAVLDGACGHRIVCQSAGGDGVRHGDVAVRALGSCRDIRLCHHPVHKDIRSEMSKGTSQVVFVSPGSHNGLFHRFRHNAGQQHADASRGMEISLKRDGAADKFRVHRSPMGPAGPRGPVGPVAPTLPAPPAPDGPAGPAGPVEHACWRHSRSGLAQAESWIPDDDELEAWQKAAGSLAACSLGLRGDTICGRQQPDMRAWQWLQWLRIAAGPGRWNEAIVPTASTRSQNKRVTCGASSPGRTGRSSDACKVRRIRSDLAKVAE